MSARLSLRELRVHLGGRTVIDIAELDAAAGELLVVAAESGHGKTTLAAALAGSIASRGEVRLDAALLTGGPAKRRRAGLTAAVRDGGRIAGCTVEEALRLAAGHMSRAEDALSRLPQLATRRRVDGELLSGGEQQLLQVACAWAAAAKVLVLDSPTVGLAADAADAVVALARDAAGSGCVVVWLESDLRAAPDPPARRLVSGRLESATESGPVAV